MLFEGAIDAAVWVGGASYIGSILWLVRGLQKPAPPADNTGQPTLSIIVAARDEEKALEGCLQALSEQDYEGVWEVVVVDDRSRDSTGELAGRWAERWAALKVVRASDQPLFRCPKKSALAQGIAASSGEVLLFTDADCRPPRHWARSMAAHFGPRVGLVAGHAHTRAGESLMQRVLSLENTAIGALAAGSFSQGKPLSCTGRNLGYRRAVYDEVGGYAAIGHLLGGDDVYFMRRVAECSDWQLVFNRDAVVQSLPASSDWSAIVHQKMRHAAKGGHYRGPALVLAGCVYIFHLALGVGLLTAAGGWYWGLSLWAFWAMRWFVDILLLLAMQRGKAKGWLWYVPLLEVLYIPYVALLAPAGRLGLFRWKK